MMYLLVCQKIVLLKDGTKGGWGCAPNVEFCHSDIWTVRVDLWKQTDWVLKFFLAGMWFDKLVSPNAGKNLHVHVGESQEGENPCCQSGVP